MKTVISHIKQEIQPLTKLVNNSLSQGGRERLLNPLHLTVYYKTPCRESGGRGKLSPFLPPHKSPEQEDAVEEAFEIGDRVRDIINGFKGTVVGFKDNRVVFDTYELGRCSRPADLLFKLE